MVIPGPGPVPPSTVPNTSRAPVVRVVPMEDGNPIPISGPAGAPVVIENLPGAPLEVYGPAGAPLEVSTPTGAPLEVSTPTGAPLEVSTPAGAPLEVIASDHMNALATMQGCGYSHVQVERLNMYQSQSGWTDMGDLGYFDPPASPPASWCPVCLVLNNPQTCPYIFDFHVTVYDIVNADVIGEFYNYFTVQPGFSVQKFFNVPQFPDSAECYVRYNLKWIPNGTPGTDKQFSMAVFATLRPSND